jgi:hypothetical protein
MPRGQPFNKSTSDVTDALKECFGNVTYAAKKLGVHRDTIHDFIAENPEMYQILEQIRRKNDFDFLDMAEYVLKRNLENIDTHPKTALEAARLVFDRKGKSRGWQSVNEENKAYNQEDKDRLSALMDQFTSLQSSLKSAEINKSNE